MRGGTLAGQGVACSGGCAGAGVVVHLEAVSEGVQALAWRQLRSKLRVYLMLNEAGCTAYVSCPVSIVGAVPVAPP